SYEVERFNEKLEIHASTGRPDALGRAPVYVILHNPSQLEVKVVAFYIESKHRGILPIELSNPIVLAPGASISYHVPFTIDPDDEITVKAVTARGRSYTAPEIRLSVRHPPYMLFVTVENMSLRSWYRVRVESNGVIGCVSPGVSLNQICDESAEYTITPSAILRLFKANNRKPAPIGYAFFHAMPGSYTVYLIEVMLDDHGNIVEQTVDHTTLNVTDRDVQVFFQSEFREPFTTMTILLASNNTVTLLSNGTLFPFHRPEGDIVIPFTISLGNMSEPLEDIVIEVSSHTAHSLKVLSINPSNYTISYMLPSESYSGSFVIHVQDNPWIGQEGGWLEYTLTVSGKGSYTGRTYNDLATAEGRNYVCVVGLFGGTSCYVG
ncbi:hypothetical protein DRO64_10070, partial [Candidatus Bathyarchaeota archaeon]